ncbi:MAG: peptide deformylase [Candidatus Celaenobacter antarcticus]|nr:peptide deformylase [Candidatus Celaenobacter antarcticus]MDP8315423.1 peptide deformylase [Candidatus Celaenobacter antarcticus]
MIQKIRLFGDEVLRKTAEPITPEDPKAAQVVQDLLDTLGANEEFALAAPQIGYSYRIFIINPIWIEDEDKRTPMVFINPELLEYEGEQFMLEGCLSFPEIYEKVKRAQIVKFRAQDLHGKWKNYTGRELFARAAQHENDHLDGILFVDRISSIRRKLLHGKLKKMASTTKNGVNVG